MKINTASYPFEKTHYFSGLRVIRIFLNLSLSVKRLKVNGSVTKKSIPPFSILHCFSPMHQCCDRDRSEIKLEQHKDDSRSWEKIHLNRKNGFSLGHSQETSSASERVKRNSSLGIKIKFLSYRVIKSQSSCSSYSC